MKKLLVLTIWVLKTWPSLLSFATCQSHSRFAFYAFQELFNFSLLSVFASYSLVASNKITHACLGFFGLVFQFIYLGINNYVFYYFYLF